jgi:PAS domain S-box-containing protein
MSKPIFNNKDYKSKNTQAEIFISEQWFSKMLLSMGEAVIVTDKKGDVTTMNEIAEELTGWRLSDSIGKPIDDIFNAVNEQSLTPVENPINKALKENKVTFLSNHTILIKKDKSQHYIVDSAVPIHNDNMEIVGGALIFRDVTQQSLTRKKFLENKSILKGILDNTNLVIHIKDLEGKYLFINNREEKIYNIMSPDLIGGNTDAHLTKEVADESTRTDILTAKQASLLKYEQVIKHADGTDHNYQTSKFPLYDSDNKMYAICTISYEATENNNDEIKKKLEKQNTILKNESEYDELTENMPNMFFSIDRFFKYSSFNKACEIFTGRKAEEIIGKSMKEVFPIGELLFLIESKEVMKTGKAINFMSTFAFNKNVFTYHLNIFPTKKGISVLMTDLTKQRKSEIEGIELVKSLQKKNKELQQYAFTVAHDLRTPIAKVLTLVSLYNIDTDYKINDKSIIENVASEIADLDNLLNDLNMTISQDNEQKQKEYVDFDTELKLITKVLENEIIESNAVITAEFQKPGGIVTVKSYLYSIIFNLISNAIKYRSEKIPLTIHLQTNQDAKFICLSVKDNGRGIDMKKNGDKVFGLYNRFNSKKIMGQGIGLNLVKARAELLGGKAEVESDVNHGSIFKIFFPRNYNENTIS